MELRILILSDGWPPYEVGGAEVVAHRFATRYASRGHDVGVLTTVRHGSQSVKQQESEPKIKVFSVPTCYPRLLRSYLSLYNPAVTQSIQSAIADFRPDIVHAHNVHRYLSYHSLTLCRRASIPVVLTLHDAMSVDYGRFVQAYRHQPTDIDEVPDYRVKLLPTVLRYHVQYCPFRNPMIRRVLHQSVDLRCVPSRAMAALLNTNGIPTDEVIPNGIDPEEFAALPGQFGPDPTAASQPEAPSITVAGRLTKDKGAFQALEALALLRDRGIGCRLVLLGGARGQDQLFDQRVSQLRLEDRVTYQGWLGGSDLVVAYRDSSIILVPSVYLDNYPTVVLEAMALGKPLVVTAFGGAREPVEAAECGFVVSPFDVPRMADSLERLINQPELALRLGRAGQRAVQGPLHIDRAVDRYLELMRTHVGHSRRSQSAPT